MQRGLSVIESGDSGATDECRGCTDQVDPHGALGDNAGVTPTNFVGIVRIGLDESHPRSAWPFRILP